ncbi:MAG: (Fe-S)-binding protein [Dehalobacterium sp.]
MEDSCPKDLIKCSRCGGCQAYCPLYYETGREDFVARGKIELLDNVQTGKLDWNDKLAEIFSTCLLCGACTENCPNEVRADKLIMYARKKLAIKRGLPIIKKNIFQHLLVYNGRLNAVGKMLFLYQKAGVQRLIRSTGILKLMPHDLLEIESLIPEFAGGPFRKKVPHILFVPSSKLKIAYFTGCVTNLINHQVGYSLLKIMKAHDVEVIIPEQYCCGVPAFSSGDFKTGSILGKRNLALFANLSVDYIVFDCASCLSTWLRYPELLESEEAYRLIPKIMDINRFLVEVLDIKVEPLSWGIKVTYHDPCHLKRTINGKTAPRELLKRLSPGFHFVEMELADRCCGSAGSFNLSHYHLSKKVAERKINSVLESGAQVVASSCPSCIMQLDHSMKMQGSSVRAKHVIELVAQCF